MTADQVGHQRRQLVVMPAFEPMVFDGNVLAFDKAGFAQAFAERGDKTRVGIGRPGPQKRDHRQRRLLRMRDERPLYRCRRRATEKGDDLAPPHSITSSARPSKESGKVRPSVFAVLRLRTSWTFSACTTGKSAGFSPLRMRAA